MNYIDKPTKIDKELIAILSFDDRDVLDSNLEKMQRQEDLQKAMQAGNSDHSKVIIIFEDQMSVKQVETTIWGVTENYVILKRNALIPIKSIYKIRFN